LSCFGCKDVFVESFLDISLSMILLSILSAFLMSTKLITSNLLLKFIYLLVFSSSFIKLSVRTKDIF